LSNWNLAVPDSDVDDLSLDDDFSLGEHGALPEGSSDSKRPEKGGSEKAGGLHGVVLLRVRWWCFGYLYSIDGVF
jgi:hypothetical protein